MPNATVNNQYSAEALYDGGWRSSDLLYLALEYDLSKSDAEELCKDLADIEADEMENKEDE